MEPIIIGVAGGSGSGKTTVVKKLVDFLGEEKILLLQHDDYYRDLSHLSPEERNNKNFDHPSALETELLVEHLESLLEGESAEIPVYDFKRHTRKEGTRKVQPREIILLEGILIFVDQSLRELLDLKVFIEAGDDIRLLRRIRRDTVKRGRELENVLRQYEDTVRPMHLEFVKPSKRHADLLVPGDKDVETALKKIIPHVKRSRFEI